jgi:filamentous hemagglutinin
MFSQGAGMATAGTLGTAAGGTVGGGSAFNTDTSNRQLHPDERRIARDLTAKAKAMGLTKADGSAYALKDIEDALRNAGNIEKGESVIAGMVVDPKVRDAIFDKGAVWTLGENGKLVQVLPPQPPQELVDFIKSETGATYSWYKPSAENPVAVNSPRDRLTNQPLDETGRYTQTMVVDGKVYEPKYHPCGNVDCQQSGANLDMSDPGTQAYVTAMDQQVYKDIGTGATGGTLLTPVGAAGKVLFWLGAAASGGQAATSDSPVETGFDEAMKAVSEKGGAKFFEEVLGHTPGAAARASALINLTGGWDAFVKRIKIDLFGMNPNDTKK